MASCKSCFIKIDWATVDGKTVPLDHASAGSPEGNIAVRRMPGGTLKGRYLKRGEQPEPGEVRGISHYATCPQAAEWRERKTAGRG